jgi:hypothetical protein
MSDSHFQTGGPLLGNSQVYIVREADERAAVSLRRMDYISLIEPRQQGKTSLINRLISQFSEDGYTFAVRDLMAAKSSDSSLVEWYTSLGRWLSRQLHFIPNDQWPKPPRDSASWEEFLAEVAEKAKVAYQNVVIVLDEIGAIPSDWATDFFSIIRSIYTSRQSFSFWQHLTFVIAGAYNPKSLIQDTAVSNFNVDQRITLNDFDLSQVKQLVAFLELPNELAEVVAERIYYWTGGQPYLSQQLCFYLEKQKHNITPTLTERLVDEAVVHFFNEDTRHLERIKNLNDTPELLAYIKRITTDPRKRLSAGLNDKQFELAYIRGIIKADLGGLCQIRNRIYIRALTELEFALNSNPASVISSHDNEHVFISYSHKDKRWLDELLTMLSPLIRRDRIKIWADTQIEAGALWRDEISKALANAKVAVLMVTPNFLASDFIAKHELPPLLKAARQDGLTILWIAISTSWHSETELAEYQAANEPSHPLDTLHPPVRRGEWVKICEKIKKVADAQ